MNNLKFELPKRKGNVPEVGKELPQIQYSDKNPDDIRIKLAKWAFSSLPDVREEPTSVSIPTSRALWLDEKITAEHKEAFMLDSRKFSHLHLDGSIHTMVPEEVRNEIISQGWGVKHPLDPVSVLVYAPRDETKYADTVSCWRSRSNFLGSPNGKKMGSCMVYCRSWRNNYLYSDLIITRIPDNFITGRGGRISDNGILTEVFQFAFVGIVIAILVLINKKTQ